MKFTQEQMRRIHENLLEILSEIDRICRKNHIQYTLDGGTLLGAVREGGFIPWDGDADVAMLRSEYDKFYRACKKDLNTEKFFLQEFRTDPHYPWGYSKLRMNGTVFMHSGHEHLKCRGGFFVDIFIYDQVPDNFFLRRLDLFFCFLVRKCQYSILGKKNEKNFLIRRLYSLLDKIPKRFLFQAIRFSAHLTNHRKHELARHKTHFYVRKEARYGLPSRSFDSYCDKDFEGKKFRIMCNYHPYLKALYGNYMVPPPKKEQVCFSVSMVRFPEEKRSAYRKIGE